MRNYKKIVIRKPFVTNFPSETNIFVFMNNLGIKIDRTCLLRFTHYFVPLRRLTNNQFIN